VHMDPAKLDLAKLVGAASAPVALIISTSIFLSNLTAKYVPSFDRLRAMSEEIRGKPDDPSRVRSLHEQIKLYNVRIGWLLRAVFILGAAILLFVSTVAFTSLSIVFPKQAVWTIATVCSMFAGLALLSLAVVIEMWENQIAKHALRSELGEGTPALHR
jgi:hypothetical protein